MGEIAMVFSNSLFQKKKITNIFKPEKKCNDLVIKEDLVKLFATCWTTWK